MHQQPTFLASRMVSPTSNRDNVTQSECTSLPIGPCSTCSASSTLTFKTGADRGEASRQSSELWRPSFAVLQWNQTSHPADEMSYFLSVSLSLDCVWMWASLFFPPSYNLYGPLSAPFSCLFINQKTKGSRNLQFISSCTDSFLMLGSCVRSPACGFREELPGVCGNYPAEVIRAVSLLT